MNEVRRCGQGAWLVIPPAGVAPLDLAAAVTAAGRAEIVEVVPAAATVLVGHRPGRGGALGEWLRGVAPLRPSAGAPAGPVVDIDVVYDGADLATVAAATGLGVEEVIRRHSGSEYRCEFCGFAPGFGYLGGLDRALHLPRRESPRTRVPAGAVAIAGPYSAVYPSDSPGGWHLLGRTVVPLWNPTRHPPALLAPGTVVRFRPVAALAPARPAAVAVEAGTAGRDRPPPALVVVTAGWSTTVQDAGRPGLGPLGVAPSGALDAGERALVNRLVGNPEGAPVIETAGGLVVEARRAVVVADSATAAVRTMAAGERVAVHPAAEEAWAYLAVRGGIDVAPVLGSRSRDQLAGLGPEPPGEGTLLWCGPDPGTALAVDQAPRARRAGGALTVRVVLGPRDDWFAPAAIDTLLAVEWAVTSDRSRVGVRLDGPPLARRPDRTGELPSEGLVTGAVQVPTGGRPIVMLADRPATGGYPVVAVVVGEDVGPLAQCRPGAVVRFRRA